MSNQKDNIGVVQRYVDDRKVGITFNQIIDADGEEIIAEVTVIGGDTPVQINAAGFSTLAGLKGNQKTVICDFSVLSPASNYSLKFRTALSGVLAKAGLVIFAEDAFTTTELAVTEPPAGNFQPLSPRLTEIAGLTPNDNSFIIAREDSTGWESDSGASLRGRLGGSDPSNTQAGAITLGDSLFNVFNGTSNQTWTVNLSTPSFWFVANRSPNGSYVSIQSNPTGNVHGQEPQPFSIGPGEVRTVYTNGINVFVI